MDKDDVTSTCPFCKSQLEVGTVMIHQTTLGFIMGGWSSPMFFHRRDDGEVKVLRANKSYAAFQRPDCQTLIVRPRDP